MPFERSSIDVDVKVVAAVEEKGRNSFSEERDQERTKAFCLEPLSTSESCAHRLGKEACRQESPALQTLQPSHDIDSEGRSGIGGLGGSVACPGTLSRKPRNS